MPTTTAIPTQIKLHKLTRRLEVHFSNGESGILPAELLRVHSPSAEVTGHQAGEGLLVTGKEGVAIDKVEPVGRYAVRLVFDDGHNTGLFTWAVLYELCRDQDAKWQRYLERLAEVGIKRDPGKTNEH